MGGMSELIWDTHAVDLRDPILVAAFRGWNDAAMAASSAVAFIGTTLDATRIARIDSEQFFDFQATRPIIDLSTPGEQHLEWPEIEFYAAPVPGGDRDLLLLIGPEPSMRWRTFCGLVVEAAQRVGVRRTVTLGSLLADAPHTQPVTLTTMASDDELLADLNTRTPSYHGPTGIVGVLHHAFVDAGFETMSLWAPVPHYAAGVPNPKGALALVNGIQATTSVSFDTSDLEASADEHEQQITQAVQADPRLQAHVERLESGEGMADDDDDDDSAHPGTVTQDDEQLPSGDELAGELERFLRQLEDEQPDGAEPV